MCMYIGIEDLAANALIRLLSQPQKDGKTLRFVRFSTLLDYGMAVVEKLNKKKKPTTLIYNRESNSRIFRDYSAFFKRDEDEEGYVGIQLKDNIGVEDIALQFIGQIPVDVQSVLADNRILDQFFKVAA